MAPTYEAIASHTFSGSTATVTFSNIPATWTDLAIVANIRSSRAANTGDGFNLRLNGDTSSDYSYTWIRGESSASSQRGSNQTATLLGEIPAATATAGVWGVVTATILSYANTNVFKTILSGSADPAKNVFRIVGLWRDTSAVTSIEVYSSTSSSIVADGTVALYGIKAA